MASQWCAPTSENQGLGGYVLVSVFIDDAIHSTFLFHPVPQPTMIEITDPIALCVGILVLIHMERITKNRCPINPVTRPNAQDMHIYDLDHDDLRKRFIQFHKNYAGGITNFAACQLIKDLRTPISMA